MAALQAKPPVVHPVSQLRPQGSGPYGGPSVTNPSSIQGNSVEVEAGLMAPPGRNTHRQHTASLKSSIGMAPVVLTGPGEHICLKTKHRVKS